MEANTGKNKSQNLLNKIKIEDSSSPSHESINIGDPKLELTLPTISYFLYYLYLFSEIEEEN